MPHAQITPLEHLLHCCQYTHGDEHIEEAFQILWQHPRLITTHPFDSIAHLNPIAKAAIRRFRSATRALNQATLTYLETLTDDWLTDTLTSGQYHPDMLINILRWETAMADDHNEQHVRDVVSVISKSRVALASSPSLLRVFTDLRGQLKLPADLKQLLDKLIAVRPSLPARG